MNLIRSMLTLAMIALVSVATAKEPDEAVKKVDDINLGKIERGITSVRDQYKTFTDVRDKQFNTYITDSLAGTPGQPATYLAPVEKAANQLQTVMDMELNDGLVKMVEASYSRRDKDFVDKAKAIVDERNEILNTAVKPILAAKGEDGKNALTMAIFQPSADKLAKEIAGASGLMGKIKIDQDRIEYFLTDQSRAMWNKEKEGHVSTYLLSPSYKREMGRIMRNYLVKKEYFNAERPLKAAAHKYAMDDKYYSLQLLYAFVLLINESNADSVNQGFAILKEAYESQSRNLDKERESLAFNYLRVGTRLGKLDEATFRKLLDHVRFVDDEDALIDLYNLAMAKYVMDGQFDQVADIYEKAKARNLSDKLPPAFVCIALLHSGEFSRIADEVHAKSIAELTSDSSR